MIGRILEAGRSIRADLAGQREHQAILHAHPVGCVEHVVNRVTDFALFADLPCGERWLLGGQDVHPADGGRRIGFRGSFGWTGWRTGARRARVVQQRRGLTARHALGGDQIGVRAGHDGRWMGQDRVVHRLSGFGVEVATYQLGSVAGDLIGKSQEILRRKCDKNI